MNLVSLSKDSKHSVRRARCVAYVVSLAVLLLACSAVIAGIWANSREPLIQTCGGWQLTVVNDMYDAELVFFNGQSGPFYGGTVGFEDESDICDRGWWGLRGIYFRDLRKGIVSEATIVVSVWWPICTAMGVLGFLIITRRRALQFGLGTMLILVAATALIFMALLRR